VPRYSKNGRCDYIFIMNISDIKILELGNNLKDIIKVGFNFTTELEILESIVNEYNNLISLFKYHDYLEQLYLLYNKLDKLIPF